MNAKDKHQNAMERKKNLRSCRVLKKDVKTMEGSDVRMFKKVFLQHSLPHRIFMKMERIDRSTFDTNRLQHVSHCRFCCHQRRSTHRPVRSQNIPRNFLFVLSSEPKISISLNDKAILTTHSSHLKLVFRLSSSA